MSWATKVAKNAVGTTAKFEKYTVQPTGIWATVSRFLAVDPNRSTGIPLNSQFRNPPPGANDPYAYDDPVTFPAADIADNPYWKRDMRRHYPQLSSVTQGDVVALLSVGSKAAPKDEVLQIGDVGKKQLVAVQEEGANGGIAVFLAKETGVGKSVLGEGGLPPMPPSTVGAKSYTLIEDNEQSYAGAYPCRSWS